MRNCKDVCGTERKFCMRATDQPLKPGACSIAYPVEYRKVGPFKLKTTGKRILGVRVGR